MSDNVISFFTGEPPPFTVKRNREWCDRQCKRVYVIEKTRMLECQDCKRTIEPFDYLMRRASECDRRIYDLRELDAEIRKRATERDELKNEVANLKAQRSRAVADTSHGALGKGTVRE